jgi:hypothetical protein
LLIADCGLLIRNADVFVLHPAARDSLSNWQVAIGISRRALSDLRWQLAITD